MAPDAGFEPATKWLTATYSTAELIRNLRGCDWVNHGGNYRAKNPICQEDFFGFFVFCSEKAVP